MLGFPVLAYGSVRAVAAGVRLRQLRSTHAEMVQATRREGTCSCLLACLDVGVFAALDAMRFVCRNMAMVTLAPCCWSLLLLICVSNLSLFLFYFARACADAAGHRCSDHVRHCHACCACGAGAWLHAHIIRHRPHGRHRGGTALYVRFGVGITSCPEWVYCRAICVSLLLRLFRVVCVERRLVRRTDIVSIAHPLLVDVFHRPAHTCLRRFNRAGPGHHCLY